MTLLIFPIKKQQRQEKQHSVFLMIYTFIFEYLLFVQKTHNCEIVLMLEKIKHSINLLKHNIECNFLSFNVNHILFRNTFSFSSSSSSYHSYYYHHPSEVAACVRPQRRPLWHSPPRVGAVPRCDTKYVLALDGTSAAVWRGACCVLMRLVVQRDWSCDRVSTVRRSFNLIFPWWLI